MEYLEPLVDIIIYFFMGIFGLVAFVIIITIIFGDKIENKGRFHAMFLDDKNNAIGQFRTIQYRYVKKDKPEQVKVKLKLRHPRLVPGAIVKVYIDDDLFYEVAVAKQGKVSFGKTVNKNDFKGELSKLANKVICKVKCSGFVIASAELIKVERM